MEDESKEMLDYINTLVTILVSMGYDSDQLDTLTVDEILDYALIEMSYYNS